MFFILSYQIREENPRDKKEKTAIHLPQKFGRIFEEGVLLAKVIDKRELYLPAYHSVDRAPFFWFY